MSAKRKTLEEMMAEDAPTAEEQLAFANQIIATDDELLAQAEHNEKQLREKAPEVTGRRGGKTKRKRRTEIEEFMSAHLARRVPREVILDRAEEKFDLSRDNLNKTYLRPLRKRLGLR
jgi:hypothetical protein